MVFFELIQSPVPVLTPHLPDLLSFSLQVASSKPLAHGTREAAVELEREHVVVERDEVEAVLAEGEAAAHALVLRLSHVV